MSEVGLEHEIACPNPKCHRRVKYTATGIARTRCECHKWVEWNFDKGTAKLVGPDTHEQNNS